MVFAQVAISSYEPGGGETAPFITVGAGFRISEWSDSGHFVASGPRRLVNRPVAELEDKIIPIFMRLDRRYRFELSASAILHGAWDEAYGADALADPLIQFDQATFDATWGDQSFPLADYYSLEFSSGITNVPEPSLGLLARLLAVLLLWPGSRRSTREAATFFKGQTISQDAFGEGAARPTFP